MAFKIHLFPYSIQLLIVSAHQVKCIATNCFGTFMLHLKRHFSLFSHNEKVKEHNKDHLTLECEILPCYFLFTPATVASKLKS
jgi:hypothetical protein